LSTPKIDKLFKELADGRNHSTRKLEKKTGLASLTSAIRALREEGHSIYLNPKRDSDGYLVNNYRMAV